MKKVALMPQQTRLDSYGASPDYLFNEDKDVIK